jgi:hypothetical protein
MPAVHKDDLIQIHADSPRAFTYRSFDGRDARSYLASPGQKIAWLALRGAGQIGYSIHFKSGSPFAGVTDINVPAGGLSNQFTVAAAAAHHTFPYTVSLPILGWSEDPEIRVGGPGTRLATFLIEINPPTYFPPDALNPGDWLSFRVTRNGDPFEDGFLIRFLDGKVPVVLSGEDDVINSLPGLDHTQSYEVADLGDKSSDVFRFAIEVPSLGLVDDGGKITVNAELPPPPPETAR